MSAMLACRCGALGQLLVWEWQSETYVLKQQGHGYNLNALAFSPDGQVRPISPSSPVKGQ
jgi:periodic tryptophan protein 2